MNHALTLSYFRSHNAEYGSYSLSGCLDLDYGRLSGSPRPRLAGLVANEPITVSLQLFHGKGKKECHHGWAYHRPEPPRFHPRVFSEE